jgi:hypothetical protein
MSGIAAAISQSVKSYAQEGYKVRAECDSPEADAEHKQLQSEKLYSTRSKCAVLMTCLGVSLDMAAHNQRYNNPEDDYHLNLHQVVFICNQCS